MKTKLIFLFATCLSLVIAGCKSTLYKESFNDENSRFRMVIEDYYKRNKTEIENYKMFSLSDLSPPDRQYYFLSVLPMEEDNAYVMGIHDTLSFIPSDYILYKEKIFFIHNKETNKPKEELLLFLDSLNLLDSTDVKIDLGLLKEEDAVYRKITTDDSKESVDYFICKDTPYEIRKRIKSSVYISPDDTKFEDICE